jgi:hypothetical protein
MTVLIKNRERKVLPFPAPREEAESSTIVVQIGMHRFAIHCEIEELPPAAPMAPLKPKGTKATMKITK